MGGIFFEDGRGFFDLRFRRMQTSSSILVFRNRKKNPLRCLDPKSVEHPLPYSFSGNEEHLPPSPAFGMKIESKIAIGTVVFYFSRTCLA